MANPPKPLSPKQVERLNAPSTGTAIKWMSRIQTWVFKKTGGRFGDKFLRGAAVGILTTMGRKSGEPRESPLLYLQEGRRIVLVASKGGDPKDPDWYRNAIANPDVTLTVNGVDRLMTARTATPAERAELWPQVVKAYRGYAGYQEKTDREIPLLICEPRA